MRGAIVAFDRRADSVESGLSCIRLIWMTWRRMRQIHFAQRENQFRRSNSNTVLSWCNRCCAPSARATYRHRESRRFPRRANEVAQHAPKIFMARIRHEGARIGNHPHKKREQSHVQKRIKLPFDSFLLIQKPPARAKLDFPGVAAVLKISRHRRE